VRANRGRSEHRARRLVGVALAVVLLGAAVPGARAVTRGQVEAARERVRRLQAEIEQLARQRDAVQRVADRVASRLYEARAALEETTAELARVRERLDAARARYERLRGRLEERAREAFILGPGTSLAFLLGATSLTDLSDRLEFVGAVAQSDADLAVAVDNLGNELAADERELERLRARQAEQVAALREREADLEAKLAELGRLQDRIEARRAEAERAAESLARRWREQIAAELAATAGGGGRVVLPDGVFQVCPVGDPHAVSDSFGAPRVGHLHAGVDIFAPYGTPIYAPFAGTARASSNSLGGYAVYVYGAQGYVYNAHLSQPGVSGPVQAGDVIGYVGTSGNAQGTSPHDHFEWHPNQIPGDWPSSPYGYSVLGSAVNPYPLLVQVC
jgi:murein DD-endopeptidase MepM/ murein hydrolase activator NlpD